MVEELYVTGPRRAPQARIIGLPPPNLFMLRPPRFLEWLIVAAVAAGPLSSRAADAPVLLVVGDSISAGYGLAAGEGWVTLLGTKLKSEGYDYRVVNASISGDTAAG